MIKKISVLSLSLIICFTVLTTCNSKDEFRDANWGNSKAKVTKSENTEYVFAADDIIYFNDVMYDINSEILYTFEDSGLVEAQAKFLVSDWILEDIIQNYKEMAATISEVYGSPLSEDFHKWKTQHELYEEYKDDTEYNAMYWKILEFKHEWKTAKSYYSLSLNYKDEQINYVLLACPVENAPVS